MEVDTVALIMVVLLLVSDSLNCKLDPQLSFRWF